MMLSSPSQSRYLWKSLEGQKRQNFGSGRSKEIYKRFYSGKPTEQRSNELIELAYKNLATDLQSSAVVASLVPKMRTKDQASARR